VQKIVQDHEGEISVERTVEGRTIFRIVLPGRQHDTFHTAGELAVDLPSLVPAQRDDANQNSISHPGS
jgi:hypothetical protein